MRLLQVLIAVATATALYGCGAPAPAPKLSEDLSRYIESRNFHETVPSYVVNIDLSSLPTTSDSFDHAATVIRYVGKDMQQTKAPGFGAGKVIFHVFALGKNHKGETTKMSLTDLEYDGALFWSSNFDALSSAQVLSLARTANVQGGGQPALASWCAANADAGANYCMWTKPGRL